MARFASHIASQVLVVALVVAGAGMGVFTFAPQAGAAELRELVGDWRGRGKVKLQGGGEEPVRCVVSYKAPSSSQIQQNLRCASISYRIDAVSNVRVRGKRLVGTWTEKTFDVTGELSGAVRDDGFTVSLVGNVFSAGMNVVVGGCQQTLDINVRGIDIRAIQMKLRKRC